MDIKKILIANRGEIAVRVIKTCKKLGIKTVTLFTDEDSNLPHKFLADESYSLGSGPLSSTYLNQDKIVEIAKKSGADAIHPGYGFLSENTEFCMRLQKEKIIFIGPSVEAITLMGDKKTSKDAMLALNIPLVPGYFGEKQDPDFLMKEADKIGYPVLIKATAGGGGKGMRIVYDKANFKTELEGAKREAKNAFSNDFVMLEKYIVKPRHIEVQVMSDSHDNHLHFYERECSIQRRYQKIIEESPSPALSPELREKICETAVKITKNIHYLGAGTIEFILTPDNEFYFLEMNTRLQVEHPITELVTDVDLVELQIAVAAGAELTLSQKDIIQVGHAIECRIYSEDPDSDFLPTSGTIRHIGKPLNARLDSGFTDGIEISTNYDPMLAKLICYGEDRDEAIENMLASLGELYFSGVKTNRDYLRRILLNDDFYEGIIHTHFLKDEHDKLLKEELTSLDASFVIAAHLYSEGALNVGVFNKLINFEKREVRKILIDDSEYSFQVLENDGKNLSFILEDETYDFNLLEKNGKKITFSFEDMILGSFVENQFDGISKQIFVDTEEFIVKEVLKAKRASLNADHGAGLLSPMPGKIFKILKKVGDKVKLGEPLLIMEAMKMEHTVNANKDGVVSEFLFNEGDQVLGKVLLLKIE